MAIKIDLLPGYVKLTKKFRFTITAAIVGLALWTGGLLLTYHSKQLELKTAEQNRDVVKVLADQTTAVTTATSNTLAATAGYDAFNQFALASTKSGSERAALLNLISRYINERSVVKSIDVSDGTNVIIVATVSSPDQYIQFLLDLRKARGVVFATDPRLTTTGVGGFGNGYQPTVLPQPEAGSAPVIINYPITLTAQTTLLNPIVVPPDPTGGAVAGAAGVTSGAPLTR